MMLFFRNSFLFLFVIGLWGIKPLMAQADADSVIFKNGNYMVGEIKHMDRGVATIETDYSDKDFMVEWKKISEIYTNTFYLMTLTDGRRFNGKLESVSPGTVLIITAEGSHQTYLDDIVYLKSVNQNFWSRFSASFDIGFNLTKANNLRQLNTSGSFTYWADMWSLGLATSAIYSRQTDVAPTERMDGSLNFHYFLPKDWYLPVTISFLSNTEQELDARINSQIGYGKYALHTNRAYWGFSGGFAYNNEKYTNETSHKNSMEAYLGSELNLYDIGDLSLLTNINVYPGLTEWGRLRFDYYLQTKYDLPLDFYIKFSTTINFDNKPVEGTPKTDYVFQLGFGWEWN